MRTHSPVVVTAYSIVAGTVMLAAATLGPMLLNPWRTDKVAPPPFATSALPHGSRLRSAAWPAQPPQPFCGTGAFTTFRLRRAGVFLNIEPALGSYLGVKLLGEHLGPYAWFGGALILGAAIVLTTRSHEPQPDVILE